MKLKETLHTRCRIARGRLNPNEPEYSPNELTDDGSTGRGLDDQNTQSKPSLLRKLSIDGYHHCIFSLWAGSDISYGGLNFSSQDGQVLAISGPRILLFQLMVYREMEKILGLLVIIRLSAVNLAL
ncbi:hypothetical protein Bca52824_075528 [Brassica carinata]|uniref:Uncharacterized protein n=1 Tax=Brassica carinata TaxID=52824 RepID=A0A8X7PPS4_BRACI|nr:hypothetical protein Bca52824_075528 [Brassica carinata]